MGGGQDRGQSIHVVRSVCVCPDKFKGTLTAVDAAAAMVAGVRRGGFDDVRVLPLADGGEGTLDALVAAGGGSRRRTTVTGPDGSAVQAEWAMLPGGTAVVEMARASGLGVLTGRNDPLRATSRGTGELIDAARRAGARVVIVGVGGSATTDGGLGALDALGWRLGALRVVVACDTRTQFVDAAEVFAPQKGATEAQVALLRRRLERLADHYRARTGVDVSELGGGGAGGGFAGGLAALGARLDSGFDVVAEAVGLEEALEDAPLVVTGEGRVDDTSFGGKVVGGVLDWATDANVPVVAVIAGQVGPGVADELSLYPSARLYPLTDRVWQSGETFARAATLVEEAALEAALAAQ